LSYGKKSTVGASDVNGGGGGGVLETQEINYKLCIKWENVRAKGGEGRR